MPIMKTLNFPFFSRSAAGGQPREKPTGRSQAKQTVAPAPTSSDVDGGLLGRLKRRGTLHNKRAAGVENDDARGNGSSTYQPTSNHAAPAVSAEPRRRPAPLQERSMNNSNPTSPLTSPTAMSQQSSGSRPRPRSSFRDRFWTASVANDFGGEEAWPPAVPSEYRSPLTSPGVPPSEAPSKRAAYVPRHAAADFSRTTIGVWNRNPGFQPSANNGNRPRIRHHRATSSWDGSRASSGGLRAPTPVDHGIMAAHYTHEPPLVSQTVEEEYDDPFADNHVAEDINKSDDTADASRREHRRSAPVGMDRVSMLLAVPAVNNAREEWPPSDYEQFLASAKADERAQRVEAVRRSWRNVNSSGEGSRSDSAYFSTGRRGSARTSEEGSRGASSGIREAPPAMPPTPKEWTVEAKRQSRVAQKIVEYIKPPRESTVPRVGLVREHL